MFEALLIVIIFGGLFLTVAWLVFRRNGKANG